MVGPCKAVLSFTIGVHSSTDPVPERCLDGIPQQAHSTGATMLLQGSNMHNRALGPNGGPAPKVVEMHSTLCGVYE